MRGSHTKALEAILLIFLILFGFYWTNQKHPIHFQNDVCAIFQQNPSWYASAKAAEDKWGVPIAVQMAIIEQESSFEADAAPASSTALGYAQALDLTWQAYLADTHQYSADRSSFAAATDFIGWFTQGVHKRLGISMNDTYRLYLAYHEGEGGYAKHSYYYKPWLIAVAHHVNHKAMKYAEQLKTCSIIKK